LNDRLVFKHKDTYSNKTYRFFLLNTLFSTVSIVKFTEYFITKRKGLFTKHILKWNM